MLKRLGSRESGFGIRRKDALKNAGAICVLIIVGAVLVGSCGGGGSTSSSGSPTTPTPAPSPNPPPSPSPPSSPTPSPSGGTTITITADGVSPRELTVALGARVTFVNNNLPHDMASDPHPDHTDCPEINAVGFLPAGQSGMTAALNTARTCGFHDHNQPSNESLTGRIVVR